MLRAAPSCSPLPNSLLRCTALPLSAIAPAPVDQQNNPSARNRFLASIVEIGRASRFSNHALSEIGRVCLFVVVGKRFAGTASAAPLDTACLRKCVAGVTHAVMIAVNAEHKLSDLPSRQAGILRD